MTDEKICPFMSRPTMGNVKDMDGKPLYKDEEEMREYGWIPINGFPFQQIISCQREKCMAWVPDWCSVPNTEYKECLHNLCIHEKRCNNNFKPGHCRLIERGA